MDHTGYVAELGRSARAAARELARASTRCKNEALARSAAELDANRAALLAANALDLARARERGLDAALLDRLLLDGPRVDAMIEGLTQIVALPDPVGANTQLSPCTRHRRRLRGRFIRPSCVGLVWMPG